MSESLNSAQPKQPPQRVSIALATYNGARFLREQLDSFATQTHQPDELVVGDDGSSDETLAILEQFAATVAFPVRITVNAPNLGPYVNFARTIQRCSGDVVMLSDQDDRWHPDKIGRMLDFLVMHPRCWLAVHDATLVDDTGRPLGATLADQIRSAGDNPAHGLIHGCCMAIDARLSRLFDPVPAMRSHDSWIALVAVALGLRCYLDQPLIDHRRHGSNASRSYMGDLAKASRWSRFRHRAVNAFTEPVTTSLRSTMAGLQSGIDALTVHRALLLQVVPAEQLDGAIAGFAANLAHHRRRLAVNEARGTDRVRLVLRGLGNGDYKGGSGALSMLRDLVPARTQPD
ncbi:glycosyltransferase family 2 protein [Novosphingobium lentum]|uniref:glycosyltransferase family 2 protein n=1 Tax=Novosphingobium lentum TaxID=145287 RepID=UPI00082BBC31|nr:glycosyltransferase family 2 protein [Novosphingobium lentum]